MKKKTGNKFMAAAIREAKRGVALGRGGPFGSVIVKDDKIIGRGHNQVVFKNNPRLHGEMVALEKAGKKIQNFDLTGCDIYTTCEPCPMCLCALLWSNIKTIYFGCTKRDAHDIGFRDEIFDDLLSIDRSKINLVQIDHDECLALFAEYKQCQKKVMY